MQRLTENFHDKVDRVASILSKKGESKRVYQLQLKKLCVN